MSIYWILFVTFFRIGLFTIGGGYAMLPLIQEAVTEDHDWATVAQFTDFVGIAESTPGPFAINISTFCGLHAAESVGADGVLGSLAATAGVVMPSLIIILLIAALARRSMRQRSVRAALRGGKPVVVGLIGAAGFVLLVHTLIPDGGGWDGGHWGVLPLAAGLWLIARFARLGALGIIVCGAAAGLLLKVLGCPV